MCINSDEVEGSKLPLSLFFVALVLTGTGLLLVPENYGESQAQDLREKWSAPERRRERRQEKGGSGDEFESGTKQYNEENWFGYKKSLIKWSTPENNMKNVERTNICETATEMRTKNK